MTARPQRLQLSRAKGFNLQAASMALNGLPAVKVDRTTRFGNPYVIGEPVDRKQVRRWGWNFSPQGLCVVCADAEEAVRRFWHCLHWDEAIHDWLRGEIGGKNVACWCDVDAPWCHGDPLRVIANSTRAQISVLNSWTDSQILAASRRIMSESA